MAHIAQRAFIILSAMQIDHQAPIAPFNLLAMLGGFRFRHLPLPGE